MNRYVITILSILLSISALQAQVEKEVEVTKAYVPVIERASKPTLKATISDTTSINPEVDYSISPLSINTPLKSRSINPATVTYWEFNRPSMAQVKVGAGYPLNSLMQAVASSHNASVGYVAAHIDHSGDYSSLESITGDDVNAQRILNDIDLVGGIYIGHRTLEANIDYLNNSYRRYAFDQIDDPKVNYQSIGGGVRYGDNFVDMTHLNYQIEAGYSSLWDLSSNSSSRVEVSAKAGQDIGVSDLLVDVGCQSFDEGDLYQNSRTKLGFELLNNISIWKLDLGATYHYLSGDGVSKSYIMPKLYVRHSEALPISPFAIVDGSISGNSYGELLQINPYVTTASVNEQCSADYHFRGGFEGRLLESRFEYKIYADYLIGRSSRFWALNVIELGNEVYSSYFDVVYGDQQRYSFNTEIYYAPLANLSLSMDLHYYEYKSEQSGGYLYGEPEFKAALNLDYSVRRFSAGVGAEYIGGRECTINYFTQGSSISGVSSVVELSGAVDLSAYASYRLNDGCSLFVEGSNLCNQSIYEWALYRDFGVRVTAGVKISF